MISINKLLKTGTLALVVSTLVLQACNKELPEAVPIEPGGGTGTETVLQKLDAPEFSILKAAVTKASTFASTTGNIAEILGNPDGEITFFAPDNTALLTSFALIGWPADPSTIDLARAGELDSLLKYHLIGGQTLNTSKISFSAPSTNMYLQSSLVLAPPSAALPPGLRMPIFLGKQGTANFVNNVPITGPNVSASNGIIHKPAIALLPPTTVLWQDIATNSDFSYFRAAVLKADEGDDAKTIESALKNPAANLTVFAPTNTAFQQLFYAQAYPAVHAQVKQVVIGMIKAGIIAANPGIDDAVATAQATAAVETEPYATQVNTGAATETTNLVSTPDVFNHPAFAATLTPTVVKGLVVYHIMSTRAFSVNLPTAETNFPTLLNGAIANHPGIGLKATFGPSGVTAATVKGAVNPTAANVLINPLPPNATSDKNYVNGIIHRVDQVLRPQ